MKKTFEKTLSTFVLIATLICVSGSALLAQISDSKRITKAYGVDKSTIIDIGNKYGDISIETWDKDSVWVEINYTVSEKNRERLEKKMDEISFELTQSGHYVVVNTIIGESKNMLISELIKFKETIGVGESQTEINMLLKIPDNLDLRIKNKFGNVYIDDYKGDVNIDLSNGKLKAHELTGYTNLKLNFGDAIVKQIDSGNLEIYYSDFNLSTSRRIRITSKTSDIAITEVGQLLVNSSRDEYRIRMIEDFETDANWSDFSISEFTQKSDIKMNYGDLTIESIQPTLQKMMIDAKSTRINLYLAKETDVNFDIITDEDLNLPNEAQIDSSEAINEKEKIMRYLGRTGKIEKAKAKLILNTTSANITILKR